MKNELKFSTPARAHWFIPPLQTAMYRHPKQALMLGVAVAREGIREWSAFAFETSSEVLVAEDVFARHSHDTIGTFTTRAGAKRAAKKYAASWLEREWLPLEKCVCGTIEGNP